MKNFTVIFDLDGTLVETAPDLTATLNHILDREGLPTITEEKLRPMIGQGARKMVERGFESVGRTFQDGELDRLTSDFIDHYGQNISHSSFPYPSVTEQLERLLSLGAILGVCTNKREDLAKKLLADLRMDHYFSAVLGGDSLPVKKPDPAHIIETVTRAGGEADKAIMIGDSATDIRAAKAALIPVIAVTFGYTVPGFDGCTPDITIDHYDELPQAIASVIRTT